jgi:flagellar motor switch protein FliN/FliY
MAETTGAKVGEAPRNFDLLLDIPLEVTVEIGRTRLAIRDLLQLGPGSVVELGKLAGEPLDILANGRPIARGEAVMVNDRFGVRLTDVISQSERIEGLK